MLIKSNDNMYLNCQLQSIINKDYFKSLMKIAEVEPDFKKEDWEYILNNGETLNKEILIYNINIHKCLSENEIYKLMKGTSLEEINSFETITLNMVYSKTDSPKNKYDKMFPTDIHEKFISISEQLTNANKKLLKTINKEIKLNKNEEEKERINYLIKDLFNFNFKAIDKSFNLIKNSKFINEEENFESNGYVAYIKNQGSEGFLTATGTLGILCNARIYSSIDGLKRSIKGMYSSNNYTIASVDLSLNKIEDTTNATYGIGKVENMVSYAQRKRIKDELDKLNQEELLEQLQYLKIKLGIEEPEQKISKKRKM